ncbi:MAG: hypothetical protein JJU36_15430, partial [Phycisphaeraceae bacterium]|nr:hypothetical protein [Phycisphaeraceae bacterium]
MVKLELAGIKDADAIMAFIDRHWRRGHILSRHRGLFLYDFQDGERLNFGLARNAGGRIVGLFGFMRYNSRSVPDLAGSLWKVIEDVGEPMLGLRLRRFVLDQVPHRFFAAPGAGLQTRAIYHALRMNWSRMDQYFLVNPTMERYELLRGVEPGSAGLRPMPAGVRTLELKSHGDLAAFDFDAFDHIAPFKDRDYITRRFLNHPIHRYEVHLVLLDDRPAWLLVTRIAANGGRAACRVVDLLGRTDRMDAVAGVLSAMIVRRGCEYADF